jgi:hypothetical protein
MSEKKNINDKPAQAKADWKKIWNYQWIVKNIPFFFFLALMTVLYIYNGHYHEKLSRNITETERRIKDLEYEYKTIKSEVIFRSKASELEKAVSPLGLKPLTRPVQRLDSLNTDNK